jgi:hypothetical protein
MIYRVHSVMISHKMTPLFGVNLCGFGSDRAAVKTELEAAEKLFERRAGGPLLVAVDLAGTETTPEIAAFLAAHAGQPGDPIDRLAIVGVSGWRRWWDEVTKKVRWPKKARFFEGHEPAKAWLIGETH